MAIAIPIITAMLPRKNKAYYHVLITDGDNTVIDKAYSTAIVRKDAAGAENKIAADIQVDLDEYKKNKKILNATRYNTTAPVNILALLDISED